MKTLSLILMVISSMMFTGCYIDHWFDCVNGRGPTVLEAYDLNEFTEIRLTIDADLYIIQDDDQGLEIQAQPNVIDEIDFRVRNGVLTIGRDRCIRDYDKIEIYVTTKYIESISNSGSGDIYSDQPLEIDYLNVNISGSGDMQLEIYGTQINSYISGSGNLTMWGGVNRLYHSVSGSGDLYGFGLEVDEGYVNVSGSGDSEIRVYEMLDVNISGSGDVYYIGNPEIHKRISGSGKLIQSSTADK